MHPAVQVTNETVKLDAAGTVFRSVRQVNVQRLSSHAGCCTCWNFQFRAGTLRSSIDWRSLDMAILSLQYGDILLGGDPIILSHREDWRLRATALVRDVQRFLKWDHSPRTKQTSKPRKIGRLAPPNVSTRIGADIGEVIVEVFTSIADSGRAHSNNQLKGARFNIGRWMNDLKD